VSARQDSRDPDKKAQRLPGKTPRSASSTRRWSESTAALRETYATLEKSPNIHQEGARERGDDRHVSERLSAKREARRRPEGRPDRGRRQLAKTKSQGGKRSSARRQRMPVRASSCGRAGPAKVLEGKRKSRHTPGERTSRRSSLHGRKVRTRDPD